MMFCAIKYVTLWLSVWHIPQADGEDKCKNELVNSINITTELQSDVLLPCYFEPNLFGSNKTADIAAVWTYRNITVENLLEISLQGKVMSWNMRSGRIETFPKLSESGNFSILLHKVQQSDLGLYHCHLFEGINCSIAYQELHLTPAIEELRPFKLRFRVNDTKSCNLSVKGSLAQNGLAQKWLIIAAAAGGGGLFLIVLVVSIYCIKIRCNNASNDVIYENTGFKQKASNDLLYANTGFEQRKAIELTEGKSKRKSPTSESGVCDIGRKNPRKTNLRNIYANRTVFPA